MTKVIFFGTPHFAAPILREIINSDLKVVTVFTQPPKNLTEVKKYLNHISIFLLKNII